MISSVPPSDVSFVRDFGAMARGGADCDFAACSSLEVVSIGSLWHRLRRPVQLFPTPYAGERGETPVNDLLALYCLVACTDAKHVVEFGTFTGETTLHLLHNAATGARITTVGLPAAGRHLVDELQWEASISDDKIGRAFQGHPDGVRIDLIRTDTRVFDTQALRGSADFVWVDACHEYDYVRSDTNKAFELVRNGGTIAWHDYSPACPGVVRVVHDEVLRGRSVKHVQGTQIAFVEVD